MIMSRSQHDQGWAVPVSAIRGGDLHRLMYNSILMLKSSIQLGILFYNRIIRLNYSMFIISGKHSNIL